MSSVEGSPAVSESGTNAVLDLRGRTVIVTGASSGIGAATARALYAAGARPVLAARRLDRIEELGAELGGALSVRTDVTDDADVVHLVTATVERHGRVDGLVNNAGASLHGEPVEDLDLDAFRQAVELNVFGVVRCMQAVLPAMRAQGFGRIVNISSGTTGMVLPTVGAYTATKSALNTLSVIARKELAGTGIDVGLVLPSTTATEFGGGRYRAGEETAPGLLAHSSGYVADVVLRALRTGEERIDIPHGPERPEVTAVPAG